MQQYWESWQSQLPAAVPTTYLNMAGICYTNLPAPAAAAVPAESGFSSGAYG